MATQIPDYKISFRRPQELKNREGNPRLHDRKQRRAIAASIRQFGFTNPVLIDASDVIIAGHARVEVAIELALTEVPTICLSHLTKAELNAYVIADNRTAELATWDKDLLAISISSISDLDPSFDVTITGFTSEEINLFADARTTSKRTVQDVPVPHVELKAISRPGDLWIIDGGHLLLCGDATSRSSYQQLLGGDRADLIITDPPYNVPIKGHVSGLGAVSHREFVMASGEMTPEAFRRFLSAAFAAMAVSSRSGSVHYIFADWRMIGDVLDIGGGEYSELLNLAVWNKTNAGMGSFLRSQHELIAIFRHGRRRHINNVALGANGRNRTNVWTYPGANSFGRGRDKNLALHPTVKPMAMIADAIMDASHQGDLVLDPFGGSGTTLLACQETGRRARLMELDPLFADVIIKRAKTIRLEARLSGCDRTFDEISVERQEHLQ
jgi:DNA modification methylase